ncbi:fasciclin domain-containing protein, partial [Glutamicibacter halophytocola]|nr:fasciclin domain-containing protein [Glutamicibacter halophytocola]
MKRTYSKVAGAFGIIAAAAMGLSACSTGSETMESPMASTSESSSPMASESAMDPAGNLVGSGCAAYAEAVPTGDGSVAGMAQDPVAVAASNNPL